MINKIDSSCNQNNPMTAAIHPLQSNQSPNARLNVDPTQHYQKSMDAILLWSLPLNTLGNYIQRLNVCTYFLFKNVFPIKMSFLFKNLKYLVSMSVQKPDIFSIFANNSKFKQDKKTSNNLLQALEKGVRYSPKNCSTLQQLEFVKIFKFSENLTGFSKTIKHCLNFFMGFRIT